MGLALLDTSAVVAYLDRDDALHESAVVEIERLVRAGASLAISAVSWAELLHGAQQGHQAEDVVRGFVDDLGVIITFVDAVVAEEAAAIQGRRRVRTPDALILATAEVGDIETVVCGDATWAKVPGLAATVVTIEER